MSKVKQNFIHGYSRFLVTMLCSFVVATQMPFDRSVLANEPSNSDENISFILKSEGRLHTIGNHHYSSGNTKFVMNIVEKNFNEEDIHVFISKDNLPKEEVVVSWLSTQNADEYEGIYVLGTSENGQQDGDYILSVEYTDLSGNAMEAFESDVVTIDTQEPVIDFQYNYELQSAIITVKEHNFYPGDMKLEVLTQDICGNSLLAGNLAAILQNETNWVQDEYESDLHRLILESELEDANYEFEINYTDLALNPGKEYKTERFVVDHRAPQEDSLEIKYSEPINEHIVETICDALQYKYYNVNKDLSDDANATITFFARDAISGVDYFTYSYYKEQGTSNQNVDAYSQIKVPAVQDSEDKSLFYATVTLPLKDDEQLRGSLEFCATDMLSNQSKAVSDSTNVIVVDSISAEMTAAYSAPNRELNDIAYYNKSVEVHFGVVEANFYKEDVQVRISKDGVEEDISSKVEWSDETTDLHIGSLVIDAPLDHLSDGDYIIYMDYKDRSNNQMTTYNSKQITIDTIPPVLKVTYSDHDFIQTKEDVLYFNNSINETFSVDERNFLKDDIDLLVYKDNKPVDIQLYWQEDKENTHIGKCSLAEDGFYTFEISGKDKAGNKLENYISPSMVVDTKIDTPMITVNGENADGKSYRNNIYLEISFNDINYEDCDINLTRTNFGNKDEDVTKQFLSNLKYTEVGGRCSSNMFERLKINDGIYCANVKMSDKAGHVAESQVVFSVNRFGSVYEYGDYLLTLIQDGGAYVKFVQEDLRITEYNADPLNANSLNIEVTRDGHPLDCVDYNVMPLSNDRIAAENQGWYQYQYVINKENFKNDGVYKISISSEDKAGNLPENNIMFRVDSVAPEITSITGVEQKIVNAPEVNVKYAVYDTMALKSVEIYLDNFKIHKITDFQENMNCWEDAFVLKEKNEIQNIRLVVTDLAGNITDTDSDTFKPAYDFSRKILISTNFWIRLWSKKIIILGILTGGIFSTFGVVIFRRKRNKK